MMHLQIARVVAACVVAGVISVGFGCKSSPDSKQTADSMNTFGVEIAKTKDAIDGSVKALEVVVASDAAAIKGNVESYSKAVGNLDKQAKVVRARANEMKAIGDEFFKDWEASEEVSKEKRAELNASYKRIKEEMAVAKESFTPFLASMKDIDAYLKLDPTLTGIGSMEALVRKANESGAQVKMHIDAVLTQVNSVRGMLPKKKS